MAVDLCGYPFKSLLGVNQKVLLVFLTDFSLHSFLVGYNAMDWMLFMILLESLGLFRIFFGLFYADQL